MNIYWHVAPFTQHSFDLSGRYEAFLSDVGISLRHTRTVAVTALSDSLWEVETLIVNVLTV